jgi:uncharacterized protein YuzE
MKIVWTKHGKERQREWERKLGITRQEVEDLLMKPEQVVPGDLEALVAQKRRDSGLLRVPFIGTGEERKILEGRITMKIRYDSESDILYVSIREEPPVDAVEEPGGVIISYGEDKQPVSVEFLNASLRHLVKAGEVSVTIAA